MFHQSGKYTVLCISIRSRDWLYKIAWVCLRGRLRGKVGIDTHWSDVGGVQLYICCSPIIDLGSSDTQGQMLSLNLSLSSLAN